LNFDLFTRISKHQAEDSKWFQRGCVFGNIAYFLLILPFQAYFYFSFWQTVTENEIVTILYST